MNISDLIKKQAKAHPNKDAVVHPIKKGNQYLYPSLTFKEFETRSNEYAQGFIKNNIKPGMKVLMFVKPSLDFSVITFALFKVGAVPIFIDPGMGRKNLFKAIQGIKPKAMVAIPQVYYLKKFFSKVFKSVEIEFTTQKSAFVKAINIQEMRGQEIDQKLLDSIEVKGSDLAAILFTSGGTGSPKGVEYTHDIFATQTHMLQELFNLGVEDVDLPGFPLFALFTMSMGMTSVIPDMDPSKPAKVVPKKVIQNILDKKATFVAGSPAIWDKVGQYCQKYKITLPSVKYLVMFGAPVSPRIHQMWKEILPNGTTYTPYGATECLPVSCISGKELEGDKESRSLNGEGTCIGKPLRGVDIKIIKQNDGVINTIEKASQCAPYEIGEIIIQSPTATRSYHQLPEKTAMAKIMDGEDFWHRMGDLGYLDKDGNLWFCGRCNHKVVINGEIYSPIQSEAIINSVEGISRSALIPYENSSAIVVEPIHGYSAIPGFNQSLKSSVIARAKEHPKTGHIKQVFVKRHFPVDVRHNIKIDRKKLKEEFWK